MNIYVNSGVGETRADRSIQLAKADVETTMVKAKVRNLNRLSDFNSPHSQSINYSAVVKEQVRVPGFQDDLYKLAK